VATLQSLKDTTGTDLMSELEKLIVKLGLEYSNLVSFVLDDAPLLSGVRNGLGALIRRKWSLKELTYCN
jgi:hypothetical protein